jgi:hypothetical protein
VDFAHSAGSLDLDSSGRPHIAYASVYNGFPAISYAVWDDAVWNTQTVDTTSGVSAKYISLQLDSSGLAHISYAYHDCLRYATWTGTEWRLETASCATALGDVYDNSLVLDELGQPGIAYHHEKLDGTSGTLRYAEFQDCAVATISPTSGGGLVSRQGHVSLSFPAEAVTSTVVITYTPQLPSATGDLVGIGRFFDLTAVYSGTGQPAALVPGASYTATITYAGNGTAIEDTLALYYWDGTRWSKEPSSIVDTTNNTVTATPNHFSLWAILGETNRVFLPIALKDY